MSMPSNLAFLGTFGNLKLLADPVNSMSWKLDTSLVEPFPLESQLSHFSTTVVTLVTVVSAESMVLVCSTLEEVLLLG